MAKDDEGRGRGRTFDQLFSCVSLGRSIDFIWIFFMRRTMRQAARAVQEHILSKQHVGRQGDFIGIPHRYQFGFDRRNDISIMAPTFAAGPDVGQAPWQGYKRGFPMVIPSFNNRFKMGEIGRSGTASCMQKRQGDPPYHYSIHEPTNATGFHITNNRSIVTADAFWDDERKPLYHWYFDRHGELVSVTERLVDQSGKGLLREVHKEMPAQIQQAARSFARWLELQRTSQVKGGA